MGEASSWPTTVACLLGSPKMPAEALAAAAGLETTDDANSVMETGVEGRSRCSLTMEEVVVDAVGLLLEELHSCL